MSTFTIERKSFAQDLAAAQAGLALVNTFIPDEAGWQAAASASGHIGATRVLELVSFPGFCTVPEAERLLVLKGLAPATVHDLVAFEGLFRQSLAGFTGIVAPGSYRVRSNDGHRVAAYLLQVGSQRFLDLTWYQRSFDPSTKFLAVKAVSQR